MAIPSPATPQESTSRLSEDKEIRNTKRQVKLGLLLAGLHCQLLPVWSDIKMEKIVLIDNVRFVKRDLTKKLKESCFNLTL